MNYRNFPLLLLAAFWFSLVAFPELVLALDVVQEKKAKEIFRRLDEGVQRTVLSNGLRVVFYRRKGAPTFSGQIWVRVGGVDEVPGVTGVSHMLEHMAFKGSKTIGTKDYDKEKVLLNRLDALLEAVPKTGPDESQQKELGELYKSLSELWIDNEFSRIYTQSGAVGLNAATGKDYTYYLVQLPSVAFELWCWMESERLLNPVFRQFYQERNVVREERRSRVDDNPNGRVYEALLATAYWSHPNRLPIIGWGPDIDNLSRKDIVELYGRYYRPDNMVIGLVGDIDFEKAKPLLEKYFGRLPVKKGPLPEIDLVEQKQEGPREAVVYFDAQPSMVIAFHKPVYPHPDDLKFWVMHTLLSGGRTSILYRELVEEKQLALSVYSSEAPGERYPSLFYVAGTPRKGVSNSRLRDEVQKILDRLKSEEVAEKRLRAAKRHVRVDFLSTMASNSGLSRALAHAELLWGDWRVLFEMYDSIIATSQDDIKRLANDYFRSSGRTYVHLEPKK